MALIVCGKCGEQKEHQAKGMCFNCYRKYSWKPKLVECKRCKRKMPMKAKGFCGGCYNFVFHLDYAKNKNYQKYHNISPELYREITKFCAVCGFDKVVDLHHLDENRKNNSRENLVGLCPNHHKMFHDQRYRDEIISQIKNKKEELTLLYKRV